MPMMVTPVVVGLTWKFILDYSFGIFNYARLLVGLKAIAPLADPKLALMTVTLVDTWQWTPFIFLVLLAGLRSLPHEPYEAADVDGATAWQTFWHITVPLLNPVMIVAFVMRMAGAIRVFDHIFVLTGGGPGTSTEVVSLLLYRKAFQSFEMGYASAVALVLTLLTALLAWWAMKRLYADNEE
jgi:multiple sugar transport system permease protein